MRLIAGMLCRNESWIIGLSLRAALTWSDSVIVLQHNCFDNTRDIVAAVAREYPDRVDVILSLDVNWNEMPMRQLMLKRARELGATHFSIVDADEILAGGTPIRDYIEIMPPGRMLQLPLYNLRGTVTKYHANGIWGNRIVSVAFRDDLRATWIGDTFHRREPQGVSWVPLRPVNQGQGGVMHCWGVSERRLRARHALYKLVERLRWPEKPVAEIERMYNWAIHGEPGNAAYGTPATWTYNAVPPDWWKPYVRWFEYLHEDAEPWQEKQVLRLLADHPGIGRGLDLFDIA